MKSNTYEDFHNDEYFELLRGKTSRRAMLQQEVKKEESEKEEEEEEKEATEVVVLSEDGVSKTAKAPRK